MPSVAAALSSSPLLFGDHAAALLSAGHVESPPSPISVRVLGNHMTDEDCERLGLPKGSRWLDSDDSRIISHPLLHPAQCPPHLLDPVTPPHASLSERRDYLVDASLAPPRVVEDINFMVPLIPPSVMPVNERLRHNLDLENRFSPSQQSKATPRAESGQPFSPPPVYTGGGQPSDDVCGIGMLVCHDAHGNCIVQELL